MIIRDMFRDDINRHINGVVKVTQEETLVQELEEYVITKELKKHFITFFNNYSDAISTGSDDTGVWISGFFGSGKSHFLKMLSYLLANKEVAGVKTVERFRKKFEDDPATFMLIDKATRGETDTILFNIDYEGSIDKDKTAVLRVFAKMFYNYLGFYGTNLKVAKLEQFVTKRGKMDEFKAVFEENNGQTWLEARDSYDFFEDDVVAAMTQTLGMSEEAARHWFDGSDTVDTSISKLVSEIREYVESKPKDFHLLFMIDEVGQYIGDSTDLLINLQSLVELIGSECKGKVWVVCTGQEAIDEIIRTRENEFSRIQARFKTRLSLSSSSADEVIQKRILRKKPEVKKELEKIYDSNESVLRNLFSFKDSVMDIKGYNGSMDFAKNFPFVPYQFIILQKVFSEIRKRGNSGKHLSGGERSMLSGFQEAAQKIQENNEYSIAPFYMFYDTVHTFLDSTIRRVIERCEKAADTNAGIEPYDVNVLKMLYLIRYIDDIKPNIENLAILMASDIRSNKLDIRNELSASLNRLHKENYIGINGDAYRFLTDEEIDIEKDIKKTDIDTTAITQRISNIIFNDIYTSKKFKKDKYDFVFDKMVDNTYDGNITGGMLLKFLSSVSDADQKNDLYLTNDSAGRAIIVLAETQYYDALERSMKIRKYVKSRNLNQLPKSQQDILRYHQEEATKLEASTKSELEKAIVGAKFYVDGEVFKTNPGDAKGKINQALEQLVACVYKSLDLVNKNADTDDDIYKVLRGDMQPDMFGKFPNSEAADKVDNYLKMKSDQKQTVSMADLQNRYQAIPYGWREIDIAMVVALLMYQQRVIIKQGGMTIQPDNNKIAEMLRKKSVIGNVIVSKRVKINPSKLREAIEFLRDLLGKMDIPTDEDGLVYYIKQEFTALKESYTSLKDNYKNASYPDQNLIVNAILQIDEVLEHAKDNYALIDYLSTGKYQDTLENAIDKTDNVRNFFKNQVDLFNEARRFEREMTKDLDYISGYEEENQALNRIRLITIIPQNGPYDYSRIPELNQLMPKVKALHDTLLKDMQADVLDTIKKSREKIENATKGFESLSKVKQIIASACDYFDNKQKSVPKENSLVQLRGILSNITDSATKYEDMIALAKLPPKPPVVKPDPNPNPDPKPARKKTRKTSFKYTICQNAVLETDADIDAYVENIRETIKFLKKGYDELEIK